MLWAPVLTRLQHNHVNSCEVECIMTYVKTDFDSSTPILNAYNCFIVILSLSCIIFNWLRFYCWPEWRRSIFPIKVHDGRKFIQDVSEGVIR